MCVCARNWLLPCIRRAVCACQVESIVISIIAMLSSPNDESPANVDAAKQWREDRDGFRKKVARIVRKSQENFD
jgi:ubiquitin-protein ligase